VTDFAVPVQYVVGLGVLVVGTAGSIIKWAMSERADYRGRWERQITRTAQAAAIPRAPSEPPPASLPPPEGDWEEVSSVRTERELMEQAAMDKLRGDLQRYSREIAELAERTPAETPHRKKMRSRPG
jgi:hypothetical protein